MRHGFLRGAPRLAALFWAFLTLALGFAPIGCGGGGGGGGGGGAQTTVVGTVLDSSRQDAGVANATVQIGGATTTTGADGSFTLQNARVGASTAVITPPPPGGGSTPVAQTVAFSPPIAAGANGPFELVINIGQVRGRVLLPGGQQVAANAFVTVLATGDSTTTGADGTFRIDNIPGGETQVTAVLGTASVTVTVNIQSGVVDLGDLVLVDDPNPSPPGLPYTIFGHISATDSSATAGLTVRLLRNGLDLEQTVTNANGDYGFYVPVGTYVIRVSKAGYQDAVGNVTVTNPSAPIRADLALVGP